MIAQSITKNSRFALAITMLGLVVGCSTHLPSGDGKGSAARTPVLAESYGQRAARIALRQLGVPYRYGGATSRGFDCSGLVQYAYGQAGKQVPRTTSQLWSAARPVGRDDLQAGDILFFRIEGKISHVGLYVGNQEFVHAPSSGRQVSVAALTSPYYAAAFIRGGRPR